MHIDLNTDGIAAALIRTKDSLVSSDALTLKRLSYFGGWTDWGGGGGIEISAVDLATVAKICAMVVCDVIYKTVCSEFPK